MAPAWPKIFRLRQIFEGPRLDDVPGEVHARLARLSLAGKVRPGQSVAITAGSRGIANIHLITRAIEDYSFERIIRSVAGEVLEKCRILAGVAIVENGYDQTARIDALAPEEFQSREKELLLLARKWMPRLPFRYVDLLLIDKIGKDLSGVGLDTNVVGRKFNDHRAVEGEFPKVKRIALRGLTKQTHGNAIGLGLAEFCKSQLLSETDFEATRLNAVVSGHVQAAMPPLDYPTDRQMLETALDTIGLTEPADAKLLWIANTLKLAEVECSTAYLDEACRRADLEILTQPRALPFDAAGNLPDFAQSGTGSLE